jgi:hypothetical protein
MTRVAALFGDLAGAVVMVMFVPVAILVVGIPLVLVVRALLAVIEMF